MSSKHKCSQRKGSTTRLGVVPSVHITMEDVARWLSEAANELHKQAFWFTNDVSANWFESEEDRLDAAQAAAKMKEFSRRADDLFADFIEFRQLVLLAHSEFSNFDEHSEPDLAPDCRKYIR